MSGRSSKAEKDLRVRAVYDLLMGNYPTSDIIRYVTEKWGVGTRTAENYIRFANEIKDNEAVKHIEGAFNNNLQQRRYLQNKAVKAGDWRLAHEIVKDEAKLLGLYPADRQEVAHNIRGKVSLAQEVVDFVTELYGE